MTRRENIKQRVVLDIWDDLVCNVKPQAWLGPWARVKGGTLPGPAVDHRTLTIGAVTTAAVEELARG